MADPPSLWTSYLASDPVFQRLTELKEKVCYHLLFQTWTQNKSDNNTRRVGQTKLVISFFRIENKLRGVRTGNRKKAFTG